MSKIAIVFLLLFSFSMASSDIQDSIADSFDSEFATQKKENFDPLRGYNVFMTNLNDKFYNYILFPVAKGYKKVVPTPARDAVSNFFDNLFFPIRFVNNLLQFKFKNSFEEMQRFILNSTVGIAGLFDVATDKFNIKEHNEDLGQTLGHYGIGEGFYLVLPILGPSSLRDTVGMVGDIFLNPNVYITHRFYNLPSNQNDATAISIGYNINKTSFNYKKYEAIKKGSVELYPLLKSLYEKQREKAIRQ